MHALEKENPSNNGLTGKAGLGKTTINKTVRYAAD
jgi:hypothetical protein